MTDSTGLYKYKALLLPWVVRGLEDLALVIAGTAWHDGDTFNALVSRGEHDYLLTHVRCAGYNAPEVTGATKDAGLAAKQFAAYLAGSFDLVYLDSLGYGVDQEDDFGRMLARVTLADGRDLAELMISTGHAVVDNP